MRRSSPAGAGRASTAMYPRPAARSLSERRSDGAWTESRADAADRGAASRRRSSLVGWSLRGKGDWKTVCSRRRCEFYCTYLRVVSKTVFHSCRFTPDFAVPAVWSRSPREDHEPNEPGRGDPPLSRPSGIPSAYLGSLTVLGLYSNRPNRDYILSQYSRPALVSTQIASIVATDGIHHE